jgi:hypothetical protein
MTDDELAKIKERCEKATPGPWEWAQDRINDLHFRIRREKPDANGHIFRAKPGSGGLRNSFIYLLKRRFDIPAFDRETLTGSVMYLRWFEYRANGYSNGPQEYDAEFIAHARSDIPALLEEVESLRKTLAWIEEGMTERDKALIIRKRLLEREDK